MMKSVWIICFIVCAILSFGCNAIVYPSRRSVYEPARKALEQSNELPPGAVIDPDRKAEVYIAKDAAAVVMDVEYKDSQRATVRRSYTIWMKRLGRRWEPDRLFPTPSYE